MENRTEPMQEQAWWKLHCASCLLVFCAVVWCCWCWLRSEWGKKTIQTYPYSNCTFHHQNSQRKQTNRTIPTNLIENFGQHNLLYVYLSAWKTGQKSCKNKHGENCVAQVVCWYFVRLCGTAGVGCEVSEGKKPSKPIHILTALFTTRIHKENKQVLPYQPTSGKLWPTQSTVCVSFSMLENRTEIMQEQTWWKLRCASCLLVFCAVVWYCWCWLRSEWGKETIQTYPYSNCTFHHQNSQRKQTSFTVPTNLGKTVANIIHCMCFFQNNGKQNRTHARTSMVKIALRKLFAGILCGCVVLLVLVAKWAMKKKHPNLSIF